MSFTDGGTEFLNSHTSSVSKKYGIRHAVARNEMHSGISERAIRSIKSRLSRKLVSIGSHPRSHDNCE